MKKFFITLLISLYQLIIFVSNVFSENLSFKQISEITFNLDTKSSNWEKGITINYQSYYFDIIYEKNTSTLNSIIKAQFSKDFNNFIINKVYLINQNALALGLEKYLKDGSTFYVEFPSLKKLHNMNIYHYIKLNENFYLKLGIDNLNFRNIKSAEEIIGFYLEF